MKQVFHIAIILALCALALACASQRGLIERDQPFPAAVVPTARKTAGNPDGRAGREKAITLVTKETSLGLGGPVVGVRVSSSPSNSMAVSADNQHVAHWGPWGRTIVVDGVKGKRYDQVGRPALSPDGTHVAYAARRVSALNEALFGSLAKGKWFVVIDGKRGKAYSGVGDVKFSPDGKRVEYQIIQRDGRRVQVSKRVKGTGFDAIRPGPAAAPPSPKSEHDVRIVRRGEKSVVAINGVAGKEYDKVGRIEFSPDGERVAYVARRGKESFAVVDGVESEAYDEIPAPELERRMYPRRGIGPLTDQARFTFSRDGKRVAYHAVRGRRWFVVIDGVKGKEYDRTYPGTLRFSQDGKRVAYVAMGDRPLRGQIAVIDGVEGKRYRLIGGHAALDKFDLNEYIDHNWGGDEPPPSFFFSPDGEHVAYLASDYHMWLVVVDGVEGKPYGDFLGRSRLVFDGSNSIRAVVVQRQFNEDRGTRDQEFFRVRIDIVEP